MQLYWQIIFFYTYYTMASCVIIECSNQILACMIASVTELRMWVIVCDPGLVLISRNTRFRKRNI